MWSIVEMAGTRAYQLYIRKLQLLRSHAAAPEVECSWGSPPDDRGPERSLD